VTGTLGEWLALRDRPAAELQAELGLEEADLPSGANFGHMTGLAMLHSPAAHPGVFFFQDGRLAVLYVEDPSAHAPDLTREALEAAVGDDAPALPSRAGKRSEVRVAADRGLAVSTSGEGADFVEIFPPTSFEDYRDRIYRKPPKFVR
jgi:hypothetical protein